MTVCTCFMVWAGWMKTTEESLAICLSRRNLPPSVMLPSQMRMIRYFDAIMKGTHPLGDALRLSRVTVTNVPDVENGSCSPFIEIYNQNKLAFSSFTVGKCVRSLPPLGRKRCLGDPVPNPVPHGIRPTVQGGLWRGRVGRLSIVSVVARCHVDFPRSCTSTAISCLSKVRRWRWKTRWRIR